MKKTDLKKAIVSVPAPAENSETETHLNSLLACNSFPGVVSFHISEVAEMLRVTRQHVNNLIDQGILIAVDVGGGPVLKKSEMKERGRRWLRIPASSFDTYVRSRAC